MLQKQPNFSYIRAGQGQEKKKQMSATAIEKARQKKETDRGGSAYQSGMF